MTVTGLFAGPALLVLLWFVVVVVEAWGLWTMLIVVDHVLPLGAGANP